jgi:hypothetical protein
VNIGFDYIDKDTRDKYRNFDCSDSGLNDYLFEEAYIKDMQGYGVTHLIINEDKNDLIGYCVLKNSALLFNDGVNYRSIPCTEIYMFALDKKYHGIKYNETINISDFTFKKIISNIRDNSEEHSGSRFIILNSKEESVNFYIKNKFKDIDINMIYVDGVENPPPSSKHIMIRQIGY